MNKILLYLLGINLLSFLLMGWDKFCAKKNLWRISEKTLLGLSLLGGGIGSLLGMLIFHHKTKKKLFQIIVPISILLAIYIYIKLLYK